MSRNTPASNQRPGVNSVGGQTESEYTPRNNKIGLGRGAAGLRTVRLASAPIITSPLSSPTESPSDILSQPRGATQRQDLGPGPRTASIDSTFSSVSSATYSQVSAQESIIVTDAEITIGVRKAGSEEAFMTQLLREKKHTASQNAQLWKMVANYREMVHKYKADFEKAIADRDRLKRQLDQERLSRVQVSSSDGSILRKLSPAASTYSIRSEDELPIQRHSVQESDSTLQPADLTPSTDSEVGSAENPALGIFEKLSASDADETSQMSPQGPEKKFSVMDARRITVVHAPRTHIMLPNPDSGTERFSPRTPKTPDFESPKSKASFTQRRSITTTPHKTSAQDPIAAQEGIPGSPPNARKAPPAPLNLHPTSQVCPQTEHSGSEYEDDLKTEELPTFDRGRKRTRADDDKEREVIMLREQQSRSQSEKETVRKSGSKQAMDGSKSKVPQSAPLLPTSLTIRSYASDDQAPFSSGQRTAPGSIAGMMQGPPKEENKIIEHILSPPAPSPGLPLSPRPINRPPNAPQPRQPRDGFLTSPLAAPPPSYPPRQPPTMSSARPTLKSLGSPTKPQAENTDGLPPSVSRSPALQPTTSSASSSSALKLVGIYQGLADDQYPDFLLPPHALPSIQIAVTSSRLKPARYSSTSSKIAEEELVFTLGIRARSDRKELWRVEKSIGSLPQLDNNLKQATNMNVKLPDRALFVGHAPAKIDARRIALENYFESILDQTLTDKAAHALCHYLSTNAIPAELLTEHNGPAQRHRGLDGRVVKEGFLTKRGKNFGGWKARYFALDDPVLRYYDSLGGSLLGTINLVNAQIGRQSSHQSHSPSRGGDEADNQFRHAILILEPKKQNSSSTIRHVLCAENDPERDDWVDALLQYVGLQHNTDDKSDKKSSMSTALSGLTKSSSVKSSGGKSKDERMSDPSPNDTREGLQGMIYTEMPSSHTPRLAAMRREEQTPSPTGRMNTGSDQASPVQPSRVISGPTNGVVIQDSGIWGNRSLGVKPVDSPKIQDKEQRKRSFWGFGWSQTPDATSTSSVDASSTTNPAKNIKPVFGLPLSEAVEYCMAPGSTICLPNVMYRCLEYLESQGAENEEGIFRLSGSSVVIKSFRERFNTEGDLDFLAGETYYDVHAVASLLKMYLRELPTHVLTKELRPEFEKVVGESEFSFTIRQHSSLPSKRPARQIPKSQSP